MGLFKGAISYSKFHVRGALPERFADRFVESIRLRAFRPLGPEDEEDQRVGWVSVHHPLDLELDHHKIFLNEYLNLGFRIDKWRIPTPIYKAHYAEAEEELLAKLGKENLSRSQKEDLAAMVTKRLRERVMPTMRVVDLSWNLNHGVLRFFSQSTKTHELLAELFEQTFGLDLVLDGVYTGAEKRGFSGAHLDALVQLEPTPFHYEPGVAP